MRLPLGPSPTQPSESSAINRGRRILAPQILVVEDGPDTRELLRELLEHCGHDVEVAENGLQGVEASSAIAPRSR